MQKLTLDIKKEITTDITTENNSVCNNAPTSNSENSFDKSEFIAKARDAEKR